MIDTLRARILLAIGVVGCPREPAIAPEPPQPPTVASAAAPVDATPVPPLVVDATPPPAAETGAAPTFYKVPSQKPKDPMCVAGTTYCTSDAGTKDCPKVFVCHTPAQCNGTIFHAAKWSPEATAAERAKGVVAACCYETQQDCEPGLLGRALIVDGAPVRAPLVMRSEWSDRPTTEDPRRARFERAALAEHAAVASFALTSLALIAHGAPAELVADTHRAALDEIEHARLFFSLAGGTRGPGPLPLVPTIPCLLALVETTFRDACVEETLGAIAAQRAAEEERDPVVRRALEKIAADEANHAILAFRTLSWAVAAAGERGRIALARALEQLPPGEIADAIVRPCARALI